jgi:hypothetical protein
VSELRFAYADPPYVGMASKYDHPDSARWDSPQEHIALMHQLDDEYDGWALSLHVPSLATLWPNAPIDARLASWVKPFAAYKRNVRVAYTWEPVIWKRTAQRRDADPVGRDHLSCPMAMQRGLFGAKPEQFCRWVLMLLGWQYGDEMVDLFPGTGVMGRVANIPTLASEAVDRLAELGER